MARLVRIVFVVMLLCLYCRGSALSKIQICGSNLVEAMRVVCSGRGYNVFWPDSNGGTRPSYGRRFKRGVVDECCKQGCSIGTLESYCSAPSTQNPNNLQIRKRSEINPRKTMDNEETLELQQIRESLKHLTKFTNTVKDPYEKRTSESLDITDDETLPNLRRKLFGHSSGELKMRHPNKFLSSDDDSRHHGYQHKHANKHRENKVPNKVKRNDASKKDSMTLDSEISEVSFLSLSGVEKPFKLGDLLADAPAGGELNFILNRNTETTAHPTHKRHHRERLNQKNKKQKNNGKNKKAKIDEAGVSGATSQIGTVAPYFSGHTLVSPSSRKGFIPLL